MTWDKVPVVVSTCGASVETSTVVASAPTFSVTLTVRAWSASRTMSDCFWVSKPGAVTDTV
jgi:hypothetical protein